MKKKIVAFLLLWVIQYFLISSVSKAYEYKLSEGFTSEAVPPDIVSILKQNSFIDDARNDFVRIYDLRYLKIKHWGFDGREHDGEMLVNAEVAKEVLDIFKELYDSKFPIKQMRLIEHFGSNDEESMSANNTSALRISECSFNARKPWHALGLAIDINPMCNPCIYPNAKESKPKFVPKNATLDRTKKQSGMIDKESVCYKAFARRGWEWGGSWDDPRGLHHFQKYTWTTDFPRKYEKVENLEQKTI